MSRAIWRTLVLGLMLGLTTFTALGCAHLGPTHNRLEHEVAALSAAADPALVDSHTSARAEGIVDLSEPPTVVDELDERPRLADRRLDFAPMLAASEIASWLPEGFDGPERQLELRNACGVGLDYAFGPSDAPGEVVEARRVLEGHTIQTQLIPEGHWLHLWEGDRWLGAAVTTVEDGRMEIAPTCDTLEIQVVLPERGPTSFAIHWELEGGDGGGPAAGPAAPIELQADAQDAPEPWGPVDAEHRIELRLANLCADPIDYAFTSTIDGEPAATATIDGHGERRVEIPAAWWLRYQTPDDGWRTGATTTLPGAVVWIGSNCLDYGVADGEGVALGGRIVD